ncbi:MAG TPA: hypothetical protein VM143_16875 [Acidimicrobiales bacterium]|nr:hypothetical protein [Acidimicrobiales bacterium]
MTTNHCPPLSSRHFTIEEVVLDGAIERFVRGGRHLFPRLADALEGIEEIGVLGWGSQGRAQALNLRDALAGTDIRVTVGLRAGSASREDARRCGFIAADGSLGELSDVAGRADLVLFLVSDAAQVELHGEVFARMKRGATLGLSHGFLISHLANAGEGLPAGVNVVGVCPKGMGLSVRRLFEQGTTKDGAGINVSVAVEQDADGRAADVALAWAIGLGAPFVFTTTMEAEFRSDLFGERGVLLGAVHGLAESAYRRLRDQGVGADEAFARSAAAITGPIAQTISRSGIEGLVAAILPAEAASFECAYAATYQPCRRVLEEIYDEVVSGRELAGVIDAGKRLERWPMPPIERTSMWRVGAERRARGLNDGELDPVTVGAFVATMIAQIDVLRERGHSWSEIANESVIEAVDSLLPYMRARGIAYMVDSCSTTARLGARRWGPIFEAAYTREAFAAVDDGAAPPAARSLESHPIHGVLTALRDFRPSVDIAVA